jgi:hypothetical protein
MTVLIRTYLPSLPHIASRQPRKRFLEELLPRSCMVVSAGLMLAGLSLPTLMAVQLLPLNLLLCCAGFALVATGGILVLIMDGEL